MGVAVGTFKVPIEGSLIGVQMRTNYPALLTDRVNTRVKVEFV